MYFDSAYVAKVYLKEPDSDLVRALARTADSLVTSAWALCEVQCTFHRQIREGVMTPRDCDDAIQTFYSHLDRGAWKLIPVTESLLKVAGAITLAAPGDVFLRAGDAVHLATARQAGEHEIWTNDRRMLAAAPYFGIVGRSV
jgi:predicted nucleic acid-binding protein